jgi:hypothetical protein
MPHFALCSNNEKKIILLSMWKRISPFLTQKREPKKMQTNIL